MSWNLGNYFFNANEMDPKLIRLITKKDFNYYQNYMIRWCEENMKPKHKFWISVKTKYRKTIEVGSIFQV